MQHVWGERRGVCRALVGKPEGKTPLGTLRIMWEDNIKIGLQEVDVGARTVLVWLSTGTRGGHL